MKCASQRTSTEMLNFEIKLTVPHRDSVDFATSHAVQWALRSLGRKSMWETNKFSFLQLTEGLDFSLKVFMVHMFLRGGTGYSKLPHE